MKNVLVTFAIVCFSFGTASAQQKLPSNFYSQKLPNGLEILVIEDNTVPLATIEIVVKNGSYTEDADYNGLSHMYEHMFFKANKDLPSQEQFLKRVQELGIAFNGTTSQERVNYYVTLTKEKLNDGLQFMNSAIRYPLFLEQEMKNELPVVNGEFQRNESNAFFFLNNDMNKTMWGKNYSRKNPIGDHDIILSCTPEKMKIIQNKFYYPNNSMIVVAGDVNHTDVYQKVASIYSDWKPSDFDPFTKWPIPEFEPLKENIHQITVNENAQVPAFEIGYHGPDTRNDIQATYAADVFSTILGQASSKFQKDLVESGLANQAILNYGTCKYVGPITIFLIPNPKTIKEAYDKLQENISQWEDPSYFTDEQLETAKNLLVIQDAYGKEKTSDYLHSVTYFWASATIDYYVNYNENVKKVTREDIRNYVKKYITNQPHVTGLLISPSMKNAVESAGISYK